MTRLILPFLMVTMTLLSAGCGHKTELKAKKVLGVRVVEPTLKEVTEYLYFTGRTEAIESLELRAQVTGYLDEVKFKAGDLVEKDQVLFQIDPRPFQALVDEANSQVSFAEAQLRHTEADLARALALNKTKGAISPQDIDRYTAAKDEAVATLASAKAKAQLADINLKFTSVRTRIAGLASRNLITEGNLVTKDQSVLTTVISQGQIYGYFDPDERTVLRVNELIRAGELKPYKDSGALVALPVQIGLANEPGQYPHSGVLNFVNNQIETGTGTVQVRGIFDNPTPPNGHPPVLSPGMFIRVRLPMGEKRERLLIPQEAIGMDQGDPFLLVVNDEKVVEYRRVRLGPIDGELQVIDPVRIIRSEKGVRIAALNETGSEDSLKHGERVIVGGLQRIRPGLTVEPKLVDLAYK